MTLSALCAPGKLASLWIIKAKFFLSSVFYWNHLRAFLWSLKSIGPRFFQSFFSPFHILSRIFVHLMVAIDRHQGNFSKCLHYNCILVTAIAVSKTRLVGTRIHCIRPSQVPSLGKRFYLLSFCTEPFFRRHYLYWSTLRFCRFYLQCRCIGLQIDFFDLLSSTNFS